MAMIKPELADEMFLADVQIARQQTDRLHVWWLGQSGFLIAWNGRCLLLDPYLSDSLTRKYAPTNKPHVRLSERVIAPDRLDFIEVVTSSHNHTDHLDSETLRPLVKMNPRLVIVCPEANRVTVRERTGLLDSQIVGLHAAGPLFSKSDLVSSINVAGFEFHAVPAAHETIETDTLGRHIYLGFVIKAGPHTIYHAGDTVLFPGMIAALRSYQVELALLPINGRAAERRVAGNLWGREAAQVARELRAGCVIPCHYDLFAFNTATTAEFESTCRLLGQPFVVLKLGTRWSSPPDPGPLRR